MTTHHTQSVRLRPTAWDALVVAAVAALAILTAAAVYGTRPADGAAVCVITAAGQETLRAPLSAMAGAQQVVESNGFALTVRFSEGQVEVLDSNCPGQDCVHTGPITRPGQSIICLPARIVIHLEGGGDAPDAVVGGRS